MNKIKDLNSRFSFHGTPFTCELRVEDHFQSDFFQEGLMHLNRTVAKRMSAAVIAPAGTGKTTLLRGLVATLPEARYRVSYLKVTDLSKRDLCREMAFVVGAETAGNYPSLVRRLQNRFAENANIDGLRPVIILDEAHEIRPDVIGILRLLTNFEMDSRLVVSIIIAGQPPLSGLLKQPRLEDIAHRLAHHCLLRLLSRDELAKYVQHRCRIAGAANSPFDPGAMEALYEIGRGNLRATDYLGLKALEAAHDADKDVVDANHVVEARRLLWG